MSFVVPAAAFEVKTVAVASVLGLLLNVFMGNCIGVLETVGQLVYCDGLQSGIVLNVSGEESLREEETRDPENFRGSSLDPIVQEVDSVVAVKNPGCKWFERQESFLDPDRWNLVVENSSGHVFELLTHSYFSNQSFLDNL